MPVWSPKFSSVASHGAGRLLLDASLCMNLYVLYQKCRRWVLQMLLLLLLLLIVAYCMLLVACCVLRVACCCCCCSCSCCCFCCCCCWCCCCCCCFPSVWLKQLSHRLSNLFHSSHFWKNDVTAKDVDVACKKPVDQYKLPEVRDACACRPPSLL